MIKSCLICNNIFTPNSNRAHYCSIKCKHKAAFKRNQERLKLGKEGIDYIIDKWNGYATKRIYGKWMKAMHPDKTTKDYLSDFPGAPLMCDNDKKSTVRSGDDNHMKLPKYRKMASEAMKGENNPNHKSNTTLRERQSRSPFSENFSKYSNKKEARKFQEEHCHKGIGSNKIEYWLNKGYSKSEAKEKLKERQTTFTLEKCIKKYGETEGTKIFNDRQNKWKKSLHENFEREGDGRSLSSQFANSIIKELCDYLNMEIPKKEKWIKDKETGNAYSYDFTYKKKIIEFNGDYWHCNPKLYEAEFFNKNKSLTAKEIWLYDKEKTKTAEKYGYEVLTVWENDWKYYPDAVLEQCKKFLNDD